MVMVREKSKTTNNSAEIGVTLLKSKLDSGLSKFLASYFGFNKLQGLYIISDTKYGA